MNFTSLTKARKYAESLKASTKRLREKAGEQAEAFLTTVETGGVAFGFGYWEGVIDDPEDFEIIGVPIPLAVGIAAHTLAFFGVGRGMENHIRAAGNGALAAHLNGVGRKLGSESKKAPGPKGELTPGNRQKLGLTAQDLYAMAA